MKYRYQITLATQDGEVLEFFDLEEYLRTDGTVHTQLLGADIADEVEQYESK